MKRLFRKKGSDKNTNTNTNTKSQTAAKPQAPQAPQVVAAAFAGGPPVEQGRSRFVPTAQGQSYNLPELPSQQDFWTFYRSHDNELNSLYPQITSSNNIDALARDIPGAQQNDYARKNRVVQLVQEANNYYSSIDTIVNAIERERQSVTASIKATKKKLAAVRHEMKDKKELEELRKEQASDVQNKNEADYHSSVLGLWRPLHPNTRGVLYTVSTVLMLISVASVGFLIMTNKNRIFPAKTAASVSTSGAGEQPSSSLFNSNNYGKVAGGGMKLRSKK